MGPVQDQRLTTRHRPSGSGDRLHALDSLRGLAAIGVVFLHLLLVPKPNPVIVSPIVSRLVMFGGTGVFLFFVISGFSLAMTMPSHDRARNPLLSYWMRRVFRIAPLFYAMIVVSMLRDQWCFGWHASLTSLAANMTFLFNLLPGHQEGIVWASWTIGVEMLFYVLFPAIYRLSTVAQMGLAAAFTVLFEVVDGFAPAYFFRSVIGCLPLFVIGILAFKAYSWLKDDPRRKVLGIAITTAGLLMLFVCALTFGSGMNIHFREPIGLGYGALVVGCLLLRPRMLESRLTFFGAISYSLYLVHAPILYACSPLFRAITTALPDSLSYFVCAVVAFGVAVPVAWVVWLCLEKPADDFGRRLNRMINGTRVPRDTLPADARAGL